KNPFHQITMPGHRWLLLDTGSFFKGSLGNICRTLKLREKSPRPPYLGQRAPTSEEWPSFEEYACNDALCASELGNYIVEQHRHLGIPLTMSVAHMTDTLFRVRSLDDDLSRPSKTQTLDLWPEVQRAKRSRYVTGCVQIPAESSIPLPPDYWMNACLSSFHGGKNGLYVAPGVYDGVTEADITSAYPCAMRQLPPLTIG